MQAIIQYQPGGEFESVIRIPKNQILDCRLSFPNRNQFRGSEGMVRHRGFAELVKTTNQLAVHKLPIEMHLKECGLPNPTDSFQGLTVAIGNRNLGNNLGFVAWHRDWSPKLFHLANEQIARQKYSMLCALESGRVVIRELAFDATGRYDGMALCDSVPSICWCTSGTSILSEGRVRCVDELIREVYDARHLLHFDLKQPSERELLESLQGMSRGEFAWNEYANRIREALQSGMRRSRYYHSCVGESPDELFLLLASGTPEELGGRLHDLGARSGLILDQGGSAGVWCSWLRCTGDVSTATRALGGYLCTSRRFRPNGSSVIAFQVNST